MPSAVTLISSGAQADAGQYAYAATAPPEARLIFLAGACPLNQDGTAADIGEYATQARKAMENMCLALEAAGAGIRDVISTRVLVASSNSDNLLTAWETVREGFGDLDVPSTLIGVTVLGNRGQLVEIEAVAAVID